MRNSVGKYRSEYLMISEEWRNIPDVQQFPPAGVPRFFAVSALRA
jgi:hypothetical protein